MNKPEAPAAPLGLTVHEMPLPDVETERRTAVGRRKMLAVLAVCAAPVVASYFTYYVVRPDSRSNYGELISPPRPIPETLPLAAGDGARVAADGLRGQWLLVTAAAGACDAGCERRLVLMRQLRETLGRDKDRVDKVWFVTDAQPPAPALLQASGALALQVPLPALSAWLQPLPGRALDDHLYLVDPMGNWMMRFPVDPEPTRLKRDIERLLRASAAWDQAGRPATAR